ncbi:MAG: Sec-independent protein translocase protein TatB [Hyphomicrobiales bacterium]
MFDIGWSELVVIAVVALIAIGPKELPGVLRTLGQYMRKVRGMAAEFQGQFNEAMREAEMADLKKQVDDMADTAKTFTDFDPLGSVRKEIDNFTNFDPMATSPAPTPESASPAAVPESAASVSAPPETVSPEAVAPAIAAPVSPDMTVPPPSSDVAVVAEVPQPRNETKSGSGA